MRREFFSRHTAERVFLADRILLEIFIPLVALIKRVAVQVGGVIRRR